MSLYEYDATVLRRAFSAPVESAVAECGGPASERIWAARHGELTIEERREVVDHVALCAQCAESWRLAGELGSPSEAEADEVEWRRPAVVLPFRRRVWSEGLRWAAAAVLVLAVGFSFENWRDQPKVLVRGEDEVAVESLVEEDKPLPRADFVLRWSAVEGATYRIEVTDEDLDPIDSAEKLTEPRYKVAAEKLAPLPAGARVFWQVEVQKNDGRKPATLKTFRVRVE